MADTDDIRGMVLPAPTPFLGNGELDEALFAEIADYYVSRGSNALFILGSVGQGAAMGLAMRKRALEVALEAVAGRVPVIPNIGTVDPYSAIELGEHARAKGVGSVALVGPYYYSDRSAEEILQHVRMVDAAVELPLFIYDNPAYQGYSITPDRLSQLRDAVPRIFGLKIAKGDTNDLLRYQSAMGREFTIFAPLGTLFPGMLMGQAGTISPPLMMASEVGVALVSAVDKADFGEALRLQLALAKYVQTLRGLTKWGRSVQREGLRHIGFAVKQYPRWPTVELPEDRKAQLYEAIDTVRAAVASTSAPL